MRLTLDSMNEELLLTKVNGVDRYVRAYFDNHQSCLLTAALVRHYPCLLLDIRIVPTTHDCHLPQDRSTHLSQQHHLFLGRGDDLLWLRSELESSGRNPDDPGCP